MYKKPTGKKLKALKERFLSLRAPKASDEYLEDVEKLHSITRTPITQIFPEIYEHWIHELNCGYEPDDFAKGSRKLAWWFCSKGPDHVYLQQITAHFKGLSSGSQFEGCTFCKGNFGSSTTSLAALFPEIAEEWNSVRNRNFNPDTVSHSSGRKAWWKCKKCNYSYKSVIANRTVNGHGCPRCHSRGIIDLRKFPEKLKQFDKKKNKGVDIRNLIRHEKYFWKCTKNPEHKWLAGVFLNDQEHCPKCFLLQNKPTKNLAQRKDLSAQFHKTKNGDLKPKNLTLHSKERVWWQCLKNAEHVWQASVGSRIKNKGNCPLCSERTIPKEESLAMRYPLVAAEMHPIKNGTVTPANVSAFSSKKIWWKCAGGPDHVWTTTVINRTRRRARCPFCENKRLSVTNSLNNYPDLLKEFDYKKNKALKPGDILAASSLRLWWICSACKREWETTAHARSIMGQGCISCKMRNVWKQKK